MIYAVLIITRWHIKIYMFFSENLQSKSQQTRQVSGEYSWRLETGDWGLGGWEERASPYGLSVSIEPHVFPAHNGTFHRSR